MKRVLIALSPLAVLAMTVGCDETLLGALPSGVSSFVAGVDGKISTARPIQQLDQDRLRLHLMDGSGDGNQHQNGGDGGQGGGGGGGGDLDQVRDRLRDGSCGDGG